MFIARMEGEERVWYALGNTEAEAMDAILDKWNQYQTSLVQTGWKNYPDHYSNAKKLDEDYGIMVLQLEPGECCFW